MFKSAILIFCLVGIACGAKYRDRDIDGKKYEASVKGNGVISPARVVFDGRFVEIYFDNRIVTAKLASEVIDNTHGFQASDEAQNWIIDIEGLD